LEQSAVALDFAAVERAVEAAGYPVHRMPSGAGHDAMILASKVPASMLFLRSPGGISHHPDETVLPEDVDAALAIGEKFLEQWRPA
jgi:allantoate deiminase